MIKEICKDKTLIAKHSEIERLCIFLLRHADWSVKSVHGTNEIYHLELYKYQQKIAVQIHSQRTKVTIGQIENFLEFVNASNSQGFTGGFIISTNGFTPSVYAYLNEANIHNLKLAVLQKNKLVWNCEEFDIQKEREKPIYIGVFTCKGGVGKTTIAAHLAGAFAINGHNVALIDVDKQKNLQKLLGKNVFVPSTNGQIHSKIDILVPEEWQESAFKNTKIIVCDCNPEFESNPLELVSKFDYCIVPTTLNPLGINKNADVIKRTFNEIRRENLNAILFILINNLFPDEEKRNQLLNDSLRTQFRKMTEDDRNCHYIDPNDAVIRFSKQLFYWGFHLFEESKPSLAFHSIGGYSYPRMDFLKLVDYLETHTEIVNPQKSRAATLIGFK